MLPKSTYFIKTFGCQMNISDSERIDAFMQSNDFSLADEISKADVVIINTCGVRQMAEDRVFGLVKNLKKKNKKTKIVVTGCLANRKDIHRRMKDVDLFFSIKDFDIFKNWIIENSLEIGNSKLEIPENINSKSNQEIISYLSIRPKYKNKFQAYVPIMTGCDNFCAYCVVPYARGRETSRPANEIISEVKNLVEKGFKSIVLLGQNVNSYKGVISNQKPVINKNSDITSYGLPVTSYLNFSQLLRKIDSIPGKFWVTFISSHPKDMSDELIETITKCKKVCETIHLPVQAGDNEILRKMNRKYTKEHYLKLIRKIKSAFKKNKPGKLFSITTDIIVGFPGETEKQFLGSAEVMKKAEFDMVYFGQYSPRPGTAAWKMKDDVSKEEKERREKFLNEILKKTALTNNKKYVGKKIEALIEKQKEGFYFGKTRTQKNVRIVSDKKDLVGKIVSCKITKASVWNLEVSEA